MVTPKILAAVYGQLEKILRAANITAGKSGRHMKYPYTMSAKIAQFPYFLYLKNNYIWMYYPLGIIVSSYFFVKIHMMSNSEESVRSWAETQRKIAEKEHHD